MFIAKRLTDITLIEKNVYSKERVKPWFLVTFNIILRHNFPENFIKFPQLVQKIWRNSLSILANFHKFSSIFWIFWHYLVTKKLMTSAYNRWCQHFFYFEHTLNRLFNTCIKLYWYLHKFSLKYESGVKLAPTPQKKLPLKTTTLLGLKLDFSPHPTEKSFLRP